MKLIFGLLFLSTTCLAAQVKTFECAPDPIVPGLGEVLQVFEGADGEAHVTKIRAGSTVLDASVRRNDQCKHVEFVDTQTDGQQLTLSIWSNFVDRRGYTSDLTEESGVSHWTCQPINGISFTSETTLVSNVSKTFYQAFKMPHPLPRTLVLATTESEPEWTYHLYIGAPGSWTELPITDTRVGFSNTIFSVKQDKGTATFDLPAGSNMAEVPTWTDAAGTSYPLDAVDLRFVDITDWKLPKLQ